MTYRLSPSQQSDNDLLTEIEVREQELPMSLAWFRRRRVHGGGPPFVRVSNRVFYRRRELRQWIADRTDPAVSAKGLAVHGLVGARS